MNTNNIKKYAPKARREFITAVSKQLNQLGIYSDKQISEVKQEGSVLLIEGKTFEPSVKTARERLVKKVQAMGYNQLVEQVAYTWFNRLCAIRYMEIHDYLGHGFRVLSHPNNPKGFEILDHAEDAADELSSENQKLDRARIVELKLAGNKDEELYRELLLGQCHKLHEAMPFLFDALDDETELLLPDNLTRTDSILRGLVDGIPAEDWQQVEVIGWLYQFYISEKKDQVIGKVVKSEDIPAATQLFTPNWIVKYLVQNSVGRQWLQTYPDSTIKSQMEYYIEPAEQSDEVNQQLKAITPESIEPETIKVLDPACGSGHILIEAYNVLKAIYEERGFRSRDIPKMILENNLYGLDIDDRAAQLSGFALMMMARDDDKRIFTRNVRLNVLSLQESNHLDLPTLWKALNLSGSWQSGTSQGLFSNDEQDLSSFNADDCMDAGGRATQDAKADNRYQLLKRTLARFTQAKTFGSLIEVPSDEHEQLKELMSTLVELQESGDSMQKAAAGQLIPYVHQAILLAQKYEAIVANPPYMGTRVMPSDMKKVVTKMYPLGKADLFSCFIEACLKMISDKGRAAMITLQNWMFLSSFEDIRKHVLENHLVEQVNHIGLNTFPTLNSKIALGAAFVIGGNKIKGYSSVFINCNSDNAVENKGELFLKRTLNKDFYCQSTDAFLSIEGSPFAYWASESILDLFNCDSNVGDIADPRQGMATTDNQRFLRYWFELDFESINFSQYGKGKWFPYNKGGDYRKWYGNYLHVVDYEDNGQVLIDLVRNKYPKISDPEFVIKNRKYYFKPGITWTDIALSPSCRIVNSGFIFDTAGPMAFGEQDDLKVVMAVVNSAFASHVVPMLNPSLHLTLNDFINIPVPPKLRKNEILQYVDRCVEICKDDWNSNELSWDFNSLGLFHSKLMSLRQVFFDSYLRDETITEELKTNEEQINNCVFIAGGLEGELNPTVEKKKLSLFANPMATFGVMEENAQIQHFSSNVEKLLSYSIGCMMGRYSLDRKGLVYAHSGNEDFYKLVAEGAYKTFPADEDGIIPLTDQEWFKDDATNRFREFVQVVWGEEHLQENLDFVAESLCLNAIKPLSKKGQSESALETIRRYLSTQFYKDHLKTYKKRPIYWLFSSGKQKAFECLVYLHRYNEGTLSRMRTEYVTPLLGKYDAYAEQLEKQIETADSTSEANRFKKELDGLIKKQVELREFDDKLKHYADMRISLDLDDGVKVNYGKFGDLLADVKAITGSAPEVN
ncbi:MAG: BREX-1 system adenine-specific DNA-methyltransferase PglX [Shewanella sp.]|nr:BREX-1 system adenine-specific DNA-methyltransferase PglX [Shewanella sp.]